MNEIGPTETRQKYNWEYFKDFEESAIRLHGKGETIDSLIELLRNLAIEQDWKK